MPPPEVAETTPPRGAKSTPQNETKVIETKVIETKIGVGALRRVASLNAVGHLPVLPALGRKRLRRDRWRRGARQFPSPQGVPSGRPVVTSSPVTVRFQ